MLRGFCSSANSSVVLSQRACIANDSSLLIARGERSLQISLALHSALTSFPAVPDFELICGHDRLTD